MNIFKNLILAFIFIILVSCKTTNTPEVALKEEYTEAIEGIVLKVTKTEDLESKWDLLESKKDKKVYKYNNITIESDKENIVNKISISYSNIKDFNYVLNPFSSSDTINDLINFLDNNGFNFAIVSKNVYNQSNNGFLKYSTIKAYRRDKRDILYTFSFHSLSSDKNLEEIQSLKNITIQGEPKEQYFKTSHYNNKHDGINLDDDVRQAIGMSSLLHCLNYDNEEQIKSFTDKELYNSAEILKDSWSINNREDFFIKIESLNSKGYSDKLKSIISLYDLMGNKHFMDFIEDNKITESDAKRLAYVAQYPKILDSLRVRTLKAWDYGRGISVCRWAYDAKYITFEECLKMMMDYRDKILRLYNSWDDFAANYIWGRMFWAAGFKDIDPIGNESLSMLSRLQNRDNNIWFKPWYLDGVNLSEYSYNTKITEILHKNDNLHDAVEFYFDGLELYNNKKFPEAAKKFADSYNKSADIKQRFRMGLLLNAFSLKNAGEKKIANQRFKLYMTNYPNDNYGSIYYAESLEALEKTDELNILLKSLPEKFLGMVEYYRIYIRTLIKLKSFDEAERLIVKYRENIINDDKSEYLTLLTAELYFLKLDFETALRFFNQCYYFYNKNNWVNYATGLCYLKKSEPEYEKAYYFFDESIKGGAKLSDEIMDFMKSYTDINSYKKIKNEFNEMG